MDKKTLDIISGMQKNEITEYHIYNELAERTKDKHNTHIIKKIAKDELRHYNFWKHYTGKEIKPNMFQVWFYYFISKIFGLVFGLKLMESGEELAQEAYAKLKKLKGVHGIIRDEQKHEEELLKMLQEERLEYAGSIVLGLNDALVELTGALAGLTFALQNGKIIALTGAVMGIAASMSMAASGYLSSREESDEKNPLKSAAYTGIAYILTVILLVLPYILIANVYIALAVMMGVAIFIIFGYTFYITVAKSLRFWPRFLEMALISLIVAIISFGVGILLRSLFGIEV